MEKNIPHFSKELIQQAADCLEKMEGEVDGLVDTCREDYRSAQEIVLTEHLAIHKREAKKLLQQIDDTGKIAQKMKMVRWSVSDIQKDPYDLLVDQFTFAYRCFYQEHNLDMEAAIPKKFLDAPIFEYRTIRGERRCIFLALAHALLNPRRNIDCREYFRCVIEGNALKM